MGQYSNFETYQNEIIDATEAFYKKYNLNFKINPIDNIISEVIRNVKDAMVAETVQKNESNIYIGNYDSKATDKEKEIYNRHNQIYYDTVNSNMEAAFEATFSDIARKIIEQRSVNNKLFKDNKGDNLFQDYSSLMSNIYNLAFATKFSKEYQEDIYEKKGISNPESNEKKVFFFKPDDNTSKKFKKFFDRSIEVTTYFKSENNYKASKLVERSKETIDEVNKYFNMLKNDNRQVEDAEHGIHNGDFQNLLTDYKVLKNHYNSRNGFVKFFWSFGTKRALKKMEAQMNTLIQAGLLKDIKNNDGTPNYDEIVEEAIEPSDDFKGIIDFDNLKEMKPVDTYHDMIKQSYNKNLEKQKNMIIDSFKKQISNGKLDYKEIDKDNYQYYEEAVKNYNKEIDFNIENMVKNQNKLIRDYCRKETRNKRYEIRDKKLQNIEEKTDFNKKNKEEFAKIGSAKTIDDAINIANQIAEKYGLKLDFSKCKDPKIIENINKMENKKVQVKTLDEINKKPNIIKNDSKEVVKIKDSEVDNSFDVETNEQKIVDEKPTALVTDMTNSIN